MRTTDASHTIRLVLRRYGLDELADWAWEQLTVGASPAEIEVSMRDTSAYKRRFRANQLRREKGLPELSPEEIITYEQQRRAVLRSYGFPEGFYDSPDDAAEALANDVSIAELERRAVKWVEYAQSRYAPDTLEQLQRLFGVTPGSLAAFAMDEERALPLLERQLASAEIAARAARFGWELNTDEAERLAEDVGDPAAVDERFAALSRLAPQLAQRLGDQTAGVDRATQLAAVAGDPTATEQVARRVERSTSQFAGGTGIAATNRGLSGLGTA